MTAIGWRDPIPTLLIVVLIPKMQLMAFIPNAHTEPTKVFSAHLAVAQHSLKLMEITRSLYTHKKGVTGANEFVEIGNHSLSATSCGLGRPLLYFLVCIIATRLL